LATEYLDLDDAFDAYAEAVEVSVQQAKDALLNIGQLESALVRPQNAAAYEDADIARQAATLFWGLAANHV
jgi:prophage maintenance system killer protein